MNGRLACYRQLGVWCSFIICDWILHVVTLFWGRWENWPKFCQKIASALVWRVVVTKQLNVWKRENIISEERQSHHILVKNVQASLYPFLSNCDRHVGGEVSCNSSFLFYSVPFLVPSMLWCCWLGIRKSIGPVKIEWWGFGMVISLEWGADCLHMVQLMPLYPQTPSCLASCKSRLVLPFWYWLTQVILEKRPLNGCSSSNSSSSANQGITLKSVVTVVFSVDLNFLGIDTHCHSISIVFSFVQL